MTGMNSQGHYQFSTIQVTCLRNRRR